LTCTAAYSGFIVIEAADKTLQCFAVHSIALARSSAIRLILARE